MNNRLLEEINRFKLLSGYDTRKTLTEQQILSEQDKNWKVVKLDGEPFAMIGPNGEFKGGDKAASAGVTNYNQLMTWYRNQMDSGGEGTIFMFPYNKKTDSNLFANSNVAKAPGQPKTKEADTSTPVLSGTATKVGQINLNGTDGVAKFTNGTLFSFFKSTDTIVLGKFTEVESCKVTMG